MNVKLLYIEHIIRDCFPDFRQECLRFSIVDGIVVISFNMGVKIANPQEIKSKIQQRIKEKLTAYGLSESVDYRMEIKVVWIR